MSLSRVALLAALLLAGCDRSYGVQSRTTFTSPVNVACVASALGSVPGVGPVTYHHDESRSTEIYPKQRKVRTLIHLWLYGDRGTSALQINQTPDGWEFSNGRRRMGSPVPADEIAHFVPLMLVVNRTIAKQCGLPVGDLQLERL